jgi:LacI family transcriptional regulator
LKADKKNIVLCTNDAAKNYSLITKLLQRKNRPDGVVVSVEKLTTPVYKACEALKLKMPKDIKVVCFSNLDTASILSPSLTTVTQPAYEMGKMAALVLFKALQKQNLNLSRESLVIPSSLVVRRSTK